MDNGKLKTFISVNEYGSSIHAVRSMVLFKKAVSKDDPVAVEKEREKTEMRYMFGPILALLTFVIAFFVTLEVMHGRYMSSGAVESLIEKGEKGNGEACWCLKEYYFLKKDMDKSDFWLEKGAMAGDPKAQYSYSAGLFSEFNLSEINEPEFWAKIAKNLDLLNKAAEQEHADAQHALGDLYREGKYVRRDLKTSEYWQRRAVNNGSEFAMKALAEILSKSRNDRESLVEAYMLTAVAVERWSRQDYTQEVQRIRDQQNTIRDKMKKLGYSPTLLVKIAEERAAAEQAGIPVKPHVPTGFDDGFFKNCEELAKK